MKKVSTKKTIIRSIYISGAAFVFAACFVLFCSFKTQRLTDDFLRQLGITKIDADRRITNSFLGGSFNIYGIKNAKNIALGNRKAVVLDIFGYVKKQVSSSAFSKEYNAMREKYKPEETIPQTPEQMKADNIAAAKKGIADIEASIKKADANTKAIFENVLVEARKNLKTIEDPLNKHHVAYTKNYEGLVKSMKENHAYLLAEWEKKYPANPLLYVKMRLQQFMNETNDIDFAAELITKKGVKYFVNPAYESKGNRWKMAFRAGKEVIEPAREFVQQWMDEIITPS